MSDGKKDAEKRVEDILRRMFDGVPEWKRQQVMRSHCLQAPEEKKARLKLIQDLSIELASVREQQVFATAFGVTAIEAVVEGDWKRVADHIDWLSFREESEDLRAKVSPLWEKFREMLRIACVEARHREEQLMKQVLGQKVEKN